MVLRKAAYFSVAFLLPCLLQAQDPDKHHPSSASNPFAITMIIIMAILLLIIGLLANVLIGSVRYKIDAGKSESSKTGNTVKVLSVILLLMSNGLVFGQDAEEARSSRNMTGELGQTAFYMIIGVLVMELVVIFVLLYHLKIILKKESTLIAETTIKTRVARIRPITTVWNRLNAFNAREKEADIDLGHNYDGIRELDNRLPPWWLYGFYISILAAGIYMWRFHIGRTAPLSEQEYAIAVQAAEIEHIAYLKKSANMVDENSVRLLTDAFALDAGKKIFELNCAACHGKSGEGTVGPNLTDEYWLHGGSIKDVFKTIKYGWPEKGMKSWKDDLSPVQMAQISGYIKSLVGTKPPNAKERQGEIYTESDVKNDGKDSASEVNKTIVLVQ
jgi:cytochrome c oxidase cbb3-type subunit 3